MNDNVVQFENKIGNRVIVTHNDLDGMGCSILYTKCFPKALVVSASNVAADEVLVNLVAAGQLPIDAHLMVADLSISKDTVEYLRDADSIKEVEIVDHHRSSIDKFKDYPFALVDTSFCTTKLLYNLYKTKFHIEDYEPLVELIDNWDRWGEGEGPSDEARDLANLFDFVGPDAFYNRFLMAANPKMTQIETALLDIFNRQKAQYLQETIIGCGMQTDREGHQFGIVYADKYLTELGHHVLEAYPELEYLVILHYREQKVYLRSRGKVNVGKLAAQCGGGGHSKAAGFPMTNNPAQRYFTPYSDVTQLNETLAAQNEYLTQLGHEVKSLADWIISLEPEYPGITEKLKKVFWGGEENEIQSQSGPVIN